MAVNDGKDNSPKFKDVDRKKGDVAHNPKDANSDDDFKYEPQKAPHNKGVDGKPEDRSKDKYNEAKRVGDDEGQEAIKTAREKYAKKKDDPPGIAAAKENSNSIKESLNQTDPQRKSQVLPQMYDKFGMVMGVLKSSGSGQQGQSLQQIQAGQPDFYEDLDANTKRLLISAITHGWAILVRNFGYQKVLQNVAQATNGYYTKDELDALNWYDPEFTPTVFRFDRLSEDYQDVIVTSLSLIGKLYKKYGEKDIPFIQPFYKPRTLRTPPKIITTPSKYSVLKFFSNVEFTTVTFNGSTDILSNNFIRIVNNTLVNNDVVIYRPDVGNTEIKGLLANSFYYVVEANNQGVKLAAAPKGAPTIINESTTSTATDTRIILSQAPIIVRGVNVTAIVVERFRVYLRRLPDQEGLVYWTNILQQYLKDPKISVTEAVTRINDDFKNSPEYKELDDQTQKETNVNDVVLQNPVLYTGPDGRTHNLSLILKDKYRTFLKRDPDLKGLNFWVDVMKKYIDEFGFHNANMKINDDFRNSDEYKKLNNIPVNRPPLKPVTTPRVIYKNIRISEIIEDKYKTFLKRSADQDGMTFWEGVFKKYIDQYGLVNASNKLNQDFKNTPEYRELQTTNTPRQISTSNTNISNNKPILSPAKIVASTAANVGANAVLTLVEEYPGYARWDAINGDIEYMLRNQYLPDFETPELLVVYLSAYSFAADLFPVIPQTKLDFNLLSILLDRYTRKIENDYMDYTLGWGVSQDRLNEAQDFNANPDTGGTGKGSSSMLQSLLPQLQQLIQQAQQKHLPNSVLEKEKMRKLLENLKQKKTENKRMANFADEGLGNDGIAGLGSNFQNGGMGGFLSQLQGFKGGGSSGEAGATAGTISTGTTGGTVTATNNVYTAQTGVVTLETLVGGTTDAKAVVKTFVTNVPVSVLAPTITNPPDSVIVDIGGGIRKDLKSIIKDKYKTFLKREPDNEGWKFWITVLQGYLKTMDFHSAILELNKQFKSSAEYNRKTSNTSIAVATSANNESIALLDPVITPPVFYKGFNISAVVRDKYLTFALREPEQEGMTYWEGVMKSEMDKSDFVTASNNLTKYFLETPEVKEKRKLAKVSTTAKPVPEVKTDNIVGFEEI